MEDLKQLEQQVKRLDDKIGGVDDKLSDILTLLTGNHMDKEDAGLVGRFNRLEKRVSVIEKWIKNAIWFALGMSVPMGIGIAEITAFVMKLISK